MRRLQRNSFDTPDAVRTFPTGRLDIVSLDQIAIGRFVFDPGWRWSKDVAPITGTLAFESSRSSTSPSLWSRD